MKRRQFLSRRSDNEDKLCGMPFFDCARRRTASSIALPLLFAAVASFSAGAGMRASDILLRRCLSTSADDDEKATMPPPNHPPTAEEESRASLRRIHDSEKAKQEPPRASWEPFNTTNPHADSWCPYAVCHNSPGCAPCRRRFLVVVASGRSGSTSLMRMLDQLPGVRMSGENNNTLLKVQETIDNLRFINYDNDMDGPWARGRVAKGSFACPAQKMFETITPPPKHEQGSSAAHDDSDTILGFKTIRFLDPGWKSDERAMDSLTTLLPCSRVVVNLRSDTASQASSSKEKNARRYGDLTTTEIQRILDDWNGRLRSVAKAFGQRAYLLDSVEWGKPDGGESKINDLVDWLGFRDCKFDRTIHDNDGHSYKRDQARIDLGPNCRYGGGNGMESIQ